MPTLTQEILRRLILAKMLYRHGESLCRVPADRMRFAMGLLSFHDAVENCLGAVASLLHAKVKDHVYLTQYYDFVHKADTAKRSLPYRSEIGKLNSLRIGVKHHGIIPDPRECLHYPSTVREFMTEVCHAYFSLDFSTLSLSDSIESDSVRERVKEVESLVAKASHREALEKMATCFFDVYDGKRVETEVMMHRFGFRPASEPMPAVLFPKDRFQDSSITIELLEKGIDTHSYGKFKILTPQVGKKSDTGRPVIKWRKDYGHRGNWTLDHAQFCYEFLVDTILKLEEPEAYASSLIGYRSLFVDKVEVASDKAQFLNALPNSALAPGAAELRGREAQVVCELERGHVIWGDASDVDHECGYIVIKDCDWGRGRKAWVFVRAADIRVTGMEIGEAEAEGYSG